MIQIDSNDLAQMLPSSLNNFDQLHILIFTEKGLETGNGSDLRKKTDPDTTLENNPDHTKF